LAVLAARLRIILIHRASAVSHLTQALKGQKPTLFMRVVPVLVRASFLSPFLLPKVVGTLTDDLVESRAPLARMTTMSGSLRKNWPNLSLLGAARQTLCLSKSMNSLNQLRLRNQESQSAAVGLLAFA
jgi:hypothetical protein